MVQATLERTTVEESAEERNLRTARRALLLSWTPLSPEENCPEAEEILAPGFRSHGPARDAFGAKAPRRRGCRMVEAFTRLDVRVTHMAAERDRVVTWVRFEGRHTGDFQGHAPSGRAVSGDGYIVHRFDAEGRIAEEWSLLRWD